MDVRQWRPCMGMAGRALACLVVVMFVPFAGAGSEQSERVLERVFDAEGRVVIERGLVADTDILFERHYRYDAAKPDNPGGGKGGGKGGGGDDPGTDCGADQHKLSGWIWSGPYSAYASSYAAEFAAAGEVWDAATGADIFGSVMAGSAGVAGQFDGVNQFDFAALGSGTIAVTTTWYNRFTGEAVESDAQYNTAYAWATDGSAGAMDVLNIAVHEIGHTFGLDHPNGPGHKIGCLSMYAYGAEGETQKRTLGDGDILGVQALYGA